MREVGGVRVWPTPAFHGAPRGTGRLSCHPTSRSTLLLRRIERSLAHYEGSIRGWRFGPHNEAGTWYPDRGETWIQTVVEND